MPRGRELRLLADFDKSMLKDEGLFLLGVNQLQFLFFILLYYRILLLKVFTF